MAEQLHNETQRDMLAWIEEGMPVYDRDNKKIGKVKFVQNGLGMIDTPAESAQLPSSAPVQLRQQLMQRGFVKIKGGILSSDRFATPDQVEGVHGDGVRLTVADGELLRL